MTNKERWQWKVHIADLKAIKIAIRRHNVLETGLTLGPLNRSLDDISQLVLHRRGEGQRPLFSRSDIKVNQDEHLDERFVISSHKQSRSRSRSRSRSKGGSRRGRSHSSTYSGKHSFCSKTNRGREGGGATSSGASGAATGVGADKEKKEAGPSTWSPRRSPERYGSERQQRTNSNSNVRNSTRSRRSNSRKSRTRSKSPPRRNSRVVIEKYERKHRRSRSPRYRERDEKRRSRSRTPYRRDRRRSGSRPPGDRRDRSPRGKSDRYDNPMYGYGPVPPGYRLITPDMLLPGAFIQPPRGGYFPPPPPMRPFMYPQFGPPVHMPMASYPGTFYNKPRPRAAVTSTEKTTSTSISAVTAQENEAVPKLNICF